MSKPMPRIGVFLAGQAAFINLYSTQGLLRELGASFTISAERSCLTIGAPTFHAVQTFAGAMDIAIHVDAASSLFTEYLQRKSAVMADRAAILH